MLFRRDNDYCVSIKHSLSSRWFRDRENTWFMDIVGKLLVPWFESLEIQTITTCGNIERTFTIRNRECIFGASKNTRNGWRENGKISRQHQKRKGIYVYCWWNEKRSGELIKKNMPVDILEKIFSVYIRLMLHNKT